MSDLDPTPVDTILAAFGDARPDHLIPILQRLQEAYGYLPREAVAEVSRRTGIPESHMYGVATFYAQFRLQPCGRHTIRACSGTACHVRGSMAVVEAVGRELGIQEGQTTPDRQFTLETVACLGTCFLAPAMMVGQEYYGNLTPREAAKTVQTYRDDGNKA